MPRKQEIIRNRLKRTKIVATLGPASSDPVMMKNLVLAGVDVFRINFSHADHHTLSSIVRAIRKIETELNRPVAILGDLRGPRIRVGNITNGQRFIEQGALITLSPYIDIDTPDSLPISYKNLARDVSRGTVILIDNGMIELVVLEIGTDDTIKCEVIRGGSLSSRRGINVPATRISLDSITQKDFRDIDFAIEWDFDFLALSFVQTASDIAQLKQYIAQQKAEIPVIAKIENHSALTNIREIVKETYGVMVARGDLALEMSIQEIPIAQKHIIRICREAAVPVITATQMLETMIKSPQPTRAEATDIANAILDGTDALMLSGETAIGDYPIETIETMVRIAHQIEKAFMLKEIPGPPAVEPLNEVDATMAYASTMIASTIDAALIVTHTTTGSTARRVAKHRSHTPVLALTPHIKAPRWLALSWGIETLRIDEDIEDTVGVVTLASEKAALSGFAQPGQNIVITAGMPFKISGKTNLIKVATIQEKT